MEMKEFGLRTGTCPWPALEISEYLVLKFKSYNAVYNLKMDNITFAVNFNVQQNLCRIGHKLAKTCLFYQKTIVHKLCYCFNKATEEIRPWHYTNHSRGYWRPCTRGEQFSLSDHLAFTSAEAANTDSATLSYFALHDLAFSRDGGSK